MKAFNKVISLVTVIAFVLSMMAVPAFAVGKADFPTAGGENFSVSYYSDSALTNQITSAAAGTTVYAKITANLPTATLRSFNVDLNVANATIESEDSKFDLSGFARRTVVGTTLNTVLASKTGANMYVTLADGSSYDSPTNKADYLNEYIYTNIGVTSFDVTAYQLTVDTPGTVKFTDAGTGAGLAIGTIDMNTGVILTVPYTIADTGLTITDGGSTPPATKKQVSYASEWKDNTVTYDRTLDDTALKTAIKANIAVKKVTDGTAADLAADKWDVAVDKTAKTATVTVTETLASDEELATGASATLTALSFNWTPIPTRYVLNKIKLGDDDITTPTTLNLDYNTYSDENTLKNAITVIMSEFADGSTTATGSSNAVVGDDYAVEVVKSTTANTATLTVTFAETGKLAANHDYPHNYSITYTNVPVVYSNIRAALSGSPFAEGTTADAVLSNVTVLADKTQGVVVTDNIRLIKDTDFTVEIEGNPATITADGKLIITLIGDFSGKTFTSPETTGNSVEISFAYTPDVITYDNYEVSFTGGNEFNATATDEEIKSKVVVKADKKRNGVLDEADVVIGSGNYTIDIDRTAKTVTVTFGADTVHASQAPITENIVLNDVVEYKNPSSSMTTRMFAEGATEANIKAAVSVTAEKWVNGVKDTSYTAVEGASADYTITVDMSAKTVTVAWNSERYATKANDVYNFAVGVTANAVITLGGGTLNEGVYEIRKGTDLTAEINIEGLSASDKIYGAEITFTTDKGTIKSATVGTGYGIVTNATYPTTSAVVEISKLTNDDATKKLITFTIDTSSLERDDVITLATSNLKLSTVLGGDIAVLPSFAGENKSAKVTELVIPTTADISATFNVKTLGAITNAADKFKSGLTVTKAGSPVAVAADKIVVDGTAKTVKLDALTVEAGTYTVKLAVPGYTTAQVNITVAYEEATNTMKVTGGTTGAESIYAGDVNGNGSIDADDYADMVLKNGESATGDNAKYDLYYADSSATINLNDIITMVYEFSQYALATITPSGIIAE